MQLTDHLWSRKCGEVGCKMKTQWYRFWNYSLKVLKCKYSVSFTFMLLIFSLCLCCFKPYNHVVKMWALEFWCKTKLNVDTVTAFSKLKNRLVSHYHRQLQRLFYCSELLENFCISFIHNCTADIPCISFYKLVRIRKTVRLHSAPLPLPGGSAGPAAPQSADGPLDWQGTVLASGLTII